MRKRILGDKDNYSKDNEFEGFLRKAKAKYLNLVYPFDRDIVELPDERAKMWQVEAAIELYNIDGNENLKSYSENGLRESYGTAGLSQGLLSELPPAHGKAIVTKVEDVIEEEEIEEEDTEEEEELEPEEGGDA